MNKYFNIIQHLNQMAGKTCLINRTSANIDREFLFVPEYR
jgi:hypothetical protein